MTSPVTSPAPSPAPGAAPGLAAARALAAAGHHAHYTTDGGHRCISHHCDTTATLTTAGLPATPGPA